PVPGGRVREMGLAFVHQHLGLIPSLSVTENLRLGALASSDRLAINWRAEHDAAAAVFSRFELALDPQAEVGALGRRTGSLGHCAGVRGSARPFRRAWGAGA
ncbi:MAG: hypothetical protein AAGD47_09925, partial [Pseudomonadota bacterium]